MIRRVTCSAAIVLASTILARSLPAQRPAPAHFETWRPPPAEFIPLTSSADSSRPAANGTGMVFGGITGFVLGYVVGGAIGGGGSS